MPYVPIGGGPDDLARHRELDPFTPPGQEERVGTFSNVLFRVDDDPDGNSYGLGERND